MRYDRRPLTIRIQQQLDAASDQIIAKAIERALEGNLAALRLCLERILPPLKSRPLIEPLPVNGNYSTLIVALLEAVSEGELTVSEACQLAALGDSPQRRLALERALAGRMQPQLPEGMTRPKALPESGSLEMIDRQKAGGYPFLMTSNEVELLRE